LKVAGKVFLANKKKERSGT